jgi:hypothetical protein
METKNNVKKQYGCLMALFDEDYGKHFVNFSKKTIPHSMIYNDPNDPDGYGYETSPHVTIKYGFTPDLDKIKLASALKGTKPFIVDLIAINRFVNPQFEVIKFDAESPVLRELRSRVDCYPNEDTHPEYHPHMTLAYVKPNSLPLFKKEKILIRVPVTRLHYSGADGKNIFINL